MALDFPDAPTNGQRFQGFEWDSANGVWRTIRIPLSEGPQAMIATGGTVTDFTWGAATYRQHVFTSGGTFAVTSLGEASNTVEYICIAGGGSGGGGNSNIGGGGGAGGMLSGSFIVEAPGSYAITVGTGGVLAGAGLRGTNGGNSSIADIATAIGGGGGGGSNSGVQTGANGGSGGGNFAGVTSTPGQGTAGQGNAGSIGQAAGYGGGGGGKLTAATNTRAGGAGYFTDINGSYLEYARGGGVPFSTITQNANRGDGGNGSSGGTGAGISGADGVVILRYAIS